MMMRLLGWGIGHLNPPDFPHEANALVPSEKDRILASTTPTQSRLSASSGSHEGEDGVSGDADEDDFDEEVIEDGEGDDELEDESGVLAFEY